MEAYAGRERQVGTHEDEHAAPALIVDVEVVLHHPPLRDLQMPAILLLVPDGDHDAGGLAALHNRDHRVRLRFPEIWIEKLVAAVLRCVANRRGPLLRTGDGPLLELGGDLAPHLPVPTVLLAVR